MVAILKIILPYSKVGYPDLQVPLLLDKQYFGLPRAFFAFENYCSGSHFWSGGKPDYLSGWLFPRKNDRWDQSFCALPGRFPLPWVQAAETCSFFFQPTFCTTGIHLYLTQQTTNSLGELPSPVSCVCCRNTVQTNISLHILLSFQVQ